MVSLQCAWICCLLIISLPVTVKSINCDKLTNEDMRNVKRIVKQCESSPSLARDPGASPKALDISSLSNNEFATLFSKKSSLKIALRAWSSSIEIMNFESLTSFHDERFVANKSLIELVNNRNLRIISFPVFPKGQFHRKLQNVTSPFFLRGSPLITTDNIRALKMLGARSVKWRLGNYFGTCELTHIVENLSDLNNCEIIDGNLVIDEAVGETTRKIKKINGNISITNSNITDISFLFPGKYGQLPTAKKLDVLSSNPNLCITNSQLIQLEVRGYTQRIIENNKNQLLCGQLAPYCILFHEESPSTTCVGGNLNDATVRSRIENNNCEVVLGDVSINHLINKESDLTNKLRAGLSRIRKVLNGSVVVTYNEGLKKLDFFKNLEEVHSRSCQVPTIEISANFMLEIVELRDGILLSHDERSRSCRKLLIGGNGVEGRGRVLTDEQMNSYARRFGDEFSVWIHPRDESILEYEKAQKRKLIWTILMFAVVSIVSIGAVVFYIFKMWNKSRNQENEDDDVDESKDSRTNKRKDNKGRGTKIASPTV